MDSIREEEKRFKQKEEEKLKKITDSVTKTPIIIKDDERVVGNARKLAL